MNGFYFGLLVFPLSIAALGIAVGSVMWGLNQARKWSEQNTAALNFPVQLPEVGEFSPGHRYSSSANMNKRDVLVNLVATSRRAKLVQFGANTGLIIISGGSANFTPEESKIFQQAFKVAVQELGEAHSAKKHGFKDKDEPDTDNADNAEESGVETPNAS